MIHDVVTITDAGPDAEPSQRYGWTLTRNGEPIARSTEGYLHRDHAVQMARQVIGGTYAGATFTDDQR